MFSTTGEGLQCIGYRYRQSGLRVRERSVDCGSEDVGRDHRGEYRFPARPGVWTGKPWANALRH